MDDNIEFKKRLTYDKVLRIIDSILSAGGLMVALQIMVSINIVEETMDYSKSIVFAAIVFFVLSASNVLQCVLAYKKNKMAYYKSIVYAALFAVCGLLIFILGKSLTALKIAMSVYFLSAFTNRVFSILKKPRVRNIVFNTLCGLCILAAYLVLFVSLLVEEMATIGLYLYSFILVAAALVHIISISFSQMRVGVLRKIIRKTFAAEILFGMFLLIISFSFVFQALEPGFNTFTDALWYCFAIVTTIGFGDIVAVSIVGRLLSVILGIYGLVVVALITSIIVNFYTEVKDKADNEPDEDEEEDETLTELPAEAKEAANESQTAESESARNVDKEKKTKKAIKTSSGNKRNANKK